MARHRDAVAVVRCSIVGTIVVHYPGISAHKYGENRIFRTGKGFA